MVGACGASCPPLPPETSWVPLQGLVQPWPSTESHVAGAQHPAVLRLHSSKAHFLPPSLEHTPTYWPHTLTELRAPQPPPPAFLPACCWPSPLDRYSRGEEKVLGCVGQPVASQDHGPVCPLGGTQGVWPGPAPASSSPRGRACLFPCPLLSLPR